MKNDKQQEEKWIGTCPCCYAEVYENQLYVKSKSKFYHLRCYNKKVSEVIE